jgi:hypothetical protein
MPKPTASPKPASRAPPVSGPMTETTAPTALRSATCRPKAPVPAAVAAVEAW